MLHLLTIHLVTNTPPPPRPSKTATPASSNPPPSSSSVSMDNILVPSPQPAKGPPIVHSHAPHSNGNTWQSFGCLGAPGKASDNTSKNNSNLAELDTLQDTEVKLPRPTRFKNKTPVPIQITAKQILCEALERQEAKIRPPKQKIADATELSEYQLRKRKEFEDLIRHVQWNISVWIKYMQWEESQKDFDRALSVWERALEVDYRNHMLWLKYAEVEMKNKFINHTRNVWDRAITLLPRVDQLWYKYIHMEEMLGNVAGAR
ncbi:hypothetical protein SO802_009706 [Lithocarpus litseifolius]|uniref:Uncharacterized protein n=1 Tax=Lithocarpus litseifolius TaxID=425828 RepID=A0AAW2DD79_9ROSI